MVNSKPPLKGDCTPTVINGKKYYSLEDLDNLEISITKKNRINKLKKGDQLEVCSLHNGKSLYAMRLDEDEEGMLMIELGKQRLEGIIRQPPTNKLVKI